MKNTDKTRKKAVVRYTVYCLMAALFYIVQDIPDLVPTACGENPLLLLCAALVIAAFEQTVPSIIFGAVCGILIDVSCVGTGYFAVALTLICFAESEIFKKYFVRSFWSVLVFSFFAISLVFTGYFIIFRLLGGVENAWLLFVRHYITRIVFTLVETEVLYGIFALWHNRKTQN